MRDERLPLVPRREGMLYLHRPSHAENKFDSVCGPVENQLIIEGIKNNFPDAGLKDILLYRAQDASLACEGFINYEKERPENDAVIQQSRHQVDDVVHYDDTLVESSETDAVVHKFNELIEWLFRYTLCSMERIVLSTRTTSDPDLLITTSRDKEKGVLDKKGLMYYAYGSDDKRTTIHRQNSDKVTSSINSLIEFHRHFEGGILLHAHVLFPVLVDRQFGKGHVIKAKTRTKEFGQELAQAFKDGCPFVLRLGEGIWCFAKDTKTLMQDILHCQYEAWKILRD